MFYLFQIIIVLYNFLCYAFFRVGINDYLKLSKMSKTNIRKSKKGFENFWFYKTINEKKPLGILYYLNIIFLIVILVYSVPVVAFGYIKVFQSIFLILSIVVCIIEIPTSIIAAVYSSQEEFGKPFVLFARSKYTKRNVSSLFSILAWCPTALFIYLSYQQL